MTQLDTLELAKQGDANAINTLITEWLGLPSITAKTSVKQDCLQVMLESANIPEQNSLVPLIHHGLSDLGIQTFKKVKIFGREVGEDFPDWQQEFELEVQPDSGSSTLEADVDIESSIAITKTTADSQLSVQQPSRLGSLFGALAGKAKAVGGAALQTVTTVAEATIGISEAIGDVASDAADSVVRTGQVVAVCPIAIGGAIGSVASILDGAVQTGQAVAGAAFGLCLAIIAVPMLVMRYVFKTTNPVKQNLGVLQYSKLATNPGKQDLGVPQYTNLASVAPDDAVQIRQAVAESAIGIGEVIDTALQATQIAGQALAIVGNNPTLKTAITSLNWLNTLINKVDEVKAEAAVRKLQREYPNEKPSEIAHHLMLEKAVFAGGTGLVSSLAPGQAAAMFAVDWVATAALSVELVYQIAAAYGMKLTDSERKSEAVAIFGLGLGGQTAIKAGLGLLRNLPVAGAVIGASSNAVMIYALGYAACQFYEAKQNPLTLQATLVDAQIKSEKYLEAAISQEKIMDQILVHVVLAGNPNKSWEEILPELQTANLSPASIDAIASHIKSPPSLETLLAQVNSDFAVPLIAQCHRIAHLDGVITPAEAQVIDTIKHKLKRN